MHPLRRSTFSLLVALFLMSLICPASANETTRGSSPRDQDLAYLENLPESNPYRSVLLRYQTLPKEERDTLRTWADGHAEENAPPPSLTAEQADLAREFTSAIVAARAEPPTSRADWPLLPNPEDPGNPAAIAMPGIGNLRALAKIAVKNASSLPPGEAIDIYAAIAQLGRQQRSGGTLIEQLVGVAIEGIAQAEAATRLNEFSPEELLRLSATWEQLKARPSNADALSGEREIFFRPWVENILVPGIEALLENPDAGLEKDGSTADADFTRDLRLSGLMNLGEGRHRVVLENTRDGEFIPLDLGRAVDGLELVSLDYDNRVAVIRRDGHEAVVNLESKRIVPRKNPGATLREIFKGFALMDEKSGEAALEQTLARARDHPGGAKGYGRELLVAYQKGVARHIELAEAVLAPPPDSEPAPPEDPFLALSMPTVGRLARTFNSSATQTAMLQAAIRHRLGQLHRPADSDGDRDPWGDTERSPFARESTPDGGFLLRSRYEVAPGQPVVYKFAAPDAGFIRVFTK
jgi:hypothetical protein